MADNASSSFEKMGEDWMSSGVVNISGQRTRYTKPVVKQGFGKSSDSPDLGKGDRTHRGRTLIHNANGPRQRIVEKICYPNAEGQQAKTYRNVRVMGGSGGFYGARSAAGNTGNV